MDRLEKLQTDEVVKTNGTISCYRSAERIRHRPFTNSPCYPHWPHRIVLRGVGSDGHLFTA